MFTKFDVPGIVVGSQVDVSEARPVVILDNIFTRINSTNWDPCKRSDDLSMAEFYNTFSFNFNTSSAPMNDKNIESKCDSEIFRNTTNVESRCHRETFSPTIKSVTYIDDGIIVESDKHIEVSRNQYRQGVTNTFGPKSISEDKDKYWGQDLEAIGWQLNTRYDM